MSMPFTPGVDIGYFVVNYDLATVQGGLHGILQCLSRENLEGFRLGYLQLYDMCMIMIRFLAFKQRLQLSWLSSCDYERQTYRAEQP